MATAKHVTAMVEHLECVGAWLHEQESAGRNKADLLVTQAGAICARFKKLGGLDFKMGTELSKTVNAGPWTAEQKVSLLESIDHAVTVGGAKTKDKARQKCYRFENFQTEGEWNSLKNKKVLLQALITQVCTRGWSIGLQYPDEGTCFRMAGCIVASQGIADESQIADIFERVKEECVALRKKNNGTYPHQHLVRYPNDPSGLPDEMREYAYQGQDAVSMDMPYLISAMRGVKQRTHAASKDPRDFVCRAASAAGFRIDRRALGWDSTARKQTCDSHVDKRGRPLLFLEDNDIAGASRGHADGPAPSRVRPSSSPSPSPLSERDAPPLQQGQLRGGEHTSMVFQGRSSWQVPAKQGDMGSREKGGADDNSDSADGSRDAAKTDIERMLGDALVRAKSAKEKAAAKATAKAAKSEAQALAAAARKAKAAGKGAIAKRPSSAIAKRPSSIVAAKRPAAAVPAAIAGLRPKMPKRVEGAPPVLYNGGCIYSSWPRQSYRIIRTAGDYFSECSNKWTDDQASDWAKALGRIDEARANE